jgi:VWFA-related protein
MKSGACLLVLLSTATLAVAQQASPSQPVPTFKSRTELVTVPVVVLKRQNPFRQLLWAGTPDEHITGLTKDAFEIEEDGKPQPVASFEEIASSTQTLNAVTPPDTYSNQVTSDGPVTMAVIVLDLINTPYFYQEIAREKLLKYLQNDFRADRPTMLAVMRLGGLQILHDFTTDPLVLAKSVRQLKSSYTHDPTLDSQTESGKSIGAQIDLKLEHDRLQQLFVDGPGRESYQQHQKAELLDATFLELQQLASALSIVRGMKTLVWVTGEFTLPQDPTQRQTIEKYTQTLRLLSSAGIAVYPIDAILETTNPAFDSPQFRDPSPTGQGDAQIQGIQNLMDITQKTGGDYCLLRKDLDLCFRKAMEYNSHYYLFTYYTHSAEKVHWRRIHVKVQGEDLSVRARNGYFSSGANGNPKERRKLDIAQASITPVEYRGLPISVRWTPQSEPMPVKSAVKTGLASDPSLKARPPKQAFVLGISPGAMTIDAADRNHVKLDLIVIALDTKDKVLADLTQKIDLYPNAKHLEQLRTKGFAYSNAVELPSHTAKVRFIVRDDLSERIGTVSVPIEAQ